MRVDEIDVVTYTGFFDEVAGEEVAVPQETRQVAIKLVFDREIKLRANFVVDAESAGNLDPSLLQLFVDLPLMVTLKDTTLSLAGRTATKIDQLVIPIGVRGPIDDPRITVDDPALTDALVKAGASELAAELQGKINEELKEAGIELPGELDDVGAAIKKGLGDLLGGKKKDDGG